MNTLNSGTRLTTMFLDHMIMTFVVMIVAAPGAIYDMVLTFNDQGGPPKIFLGNIYMNVFAFSLYFNKDIFLGRSPTKRILKLQVVDVKTNKPANPLRCLIRNLTIVLWPIEVVVSLINNERRIGDFVAGTRLTIFDSEQHTAQKNWPWIIASVLVGMAMTYLIIFYPVVLLLEGSGLAV